MKIHFFILITGFLASPLLGFAQQIPQFQFQLYFEDSLGNRDSLTVGYDSEAMLGGIDPQFGEVVLTTPFDSIFEVRAIHGSDVEERTLKVIIDPLDNNLGCVHEVGAKIFINAKYLPVKISHDSTLFPMDACGNVILSPHWNIFTIEHWWDACDIFCLGSASEYLEDFTIPEPGWQCWNTLTIEKEVEGKGIKTLPGIFLTTFWGPGPCNDPTFLSTRPPVGSHGGATIYPNPTTGYFSVSVPPSAAVQVELRDMTGRLVPCTFERLGDVVQFDGRHLAAGLYGVMLREKNGKTTTVKVVKL